MTEEDEDDEDGIRFATLESRFENKETVFNWFLFKFSCLQCKIMVKALVALAKYLTSLNLLGRGCVVNLT